MRPVGEGRTRALRRDHRVSSTHGGFDHFGRGRPRDSLGSKAGQSADGSRRATKRPIGDSAPGHRVRPRPPEPRDPRSDRARPGLDARRSRDRSGGRAALHLGLTDIALAVVALPSAAGEAVRKLDAVEAATVLVALRACRENQSAAARLLGMERNRPSCASSRTRGAAGVRLDPASLAATSRNDEHRERRSRTERLPAATAACPIP